MSDFSGNSKWAISNGTIPVGIINSDVETSRNSLSVAGTISGEFLNSG